MEDYLSDIISSLSFQEMKILAILSEKESDAPFKAISRQELMHESELSVSVFQKYLERLEVTKTIEVLKDGKKHRIYISKYGKLALNNL